MASSVNKAILIGRLGKDPETKFTQGGVAIARFSLATDESWKDQNGEQQQRTEWHNIVAGRRLAEICGQYLMKGKLVYIEGRIQTRSWEDKEGNKKYTTEVVVNPFGGIQILGSSGRDSSGGEPMNQEPKVSEEDTSQVQEDDLPF